MEGETKRQIDSALLVERLAEAFHAHVDLVRDWSHFCLGIVDLYIREGGREG
jgi:hypothetical protein